MSLFDETEQGLADFVRAELEDGVSFEDFLADFDITPEETFVALWQAGKIDPSKLEYRLLDFE